MRLRLNSGQSLPQGAVSFPPPNVPCLAVQRCTRVGGHPQSATPVCCGLNPAVQAHRGGASLEALYGERAMWIERGGGGGGRRDWRRWR